MKKIFVPANVIALGNTNSKTTVTAANATEKLEYFLKTKDGKEANKELQESINAIKERIQAQEDKLKAAKVKAKLQVKKLQDKFRADVEKWYVENQEKVDKRIAKDKGENSDLDDEDQPAPNKSKNTGKKPNGKK